jgi:hypothetical protein
MLAMCIKKYYLFISKNKKKMVIVVEKEEKLSGFAKPGLVVHKILRCHPPIKLGAYMLSYSSPFININSILFQ